MTPTSLRCRHLTRVARHNLFPLLQAMLDRYFELLPRVCGMPLDFLSFRRFLFAGLPSYGSSPLRPGFDRILQVRHWATFSNPVEQLHICLSTGYGTAQTLPESRTAAGSSSHLGVSAMGTWIIEGL